MVRCLELELLLFWFFRELSFVLVSQRIKLMGGQSSKENNLRQNPSLRSSSSASSWSGYLDPHSGYGQGGYPYTYDTQQPSYPPQQYYDAQPPPPPPPSQNYGYESHVSDRPRHDDKKRLERKYSRIADNYNSIDEVCKGCFACKVLFNCIHI